LASRFLIVFGVDDKLIKHNPTFTLIPGQQVHRGLIISAVLQGSTQHFAIDCRLNEFLVGGLLVCQQAAWFRITTLLCSGLHQNLSDRPGHLLMITLG
jgi:hypothetical protein